MDTLLQVLDKEPIAPRQLNPKISKDLDTICLRCLEKKLSQRFVSALELKMEVGRWLDGKPIHARPVGLRERVWKWASRNQAVASLLVIAVTSLMAGTSISTWLGIKFYRSSVAERIAKEDVQSKGAKANELAASNAELALSEASANSILRNLNSRLLIEKSLLQLQNGQLSAGLDGLSKAIPLGDEQLKRVAKMNISLWGHNLHEMLTIHQFERSICKIAASDSADEIVLMFCDDARRNVAEIQLWNTSLNKPIGSALALQPPQKSSIRTSAVKIPGKKEMVVSAGALVSRYNLETQELSSEPVTLEITILGF